MRGEEVQCDECGERYDDSEPRCPECETDSRVRRAQAKIERLQYGFAESLKDAAKLRTELKDMKTRAQRAETEMARALGRIHALRLERDWYRGGGGRCCEALSGQVPDEENRAREEDR